MENSKEGNIQQKGNEPPKTQDLVDWLKSLPEGSKVSVGPYQPEGLTLVPRSSLLNQMKNLHPMPENPLQLLLEGPFEPFEITNCPEMFEEYPNLDYVDIYQRVNMWWTQNIGHKNG